MRCSSPSGVTDSCRTASWRVSSSPRSAFRGSPNSRCARTARRARRPGSRSHRPRPLRGRRSASRASPAWESCSRSSASGSCTAPGRSDLAVWLATWAFGPILLALVISIARPIFLDRYLVTTAPAFAMLAAVAVMSVAGRLRAGVVVGQPLWRPRSGSWCGTQTADDGNWRGEDWRSAVATVMARRGDAASSSLPGGRTTRRSTTAPPPTTSRQRIRSGFSTGRKTARRFRPTSGVRSASVITCWWRSFSSAGG